MNLCFCQGMGAFDMAIASINPATGQVLRTFEPLSDSQIEGKVRRASETFPKFRKLTFAERGRMMKQAAGILRQEKESLARLMTSEMGKTLPPPPWTRPSKCAWACDFYADNAEHFLADEVGGNHRQPKAMCATSPWESFCWSCRGDFPFLAGLSLYRAGIDGRQRRDPEARVQHIAAVRFEDRGNSPPGRLPGRRLSDPADWVRQGGQASGRSTRRGGHAHRKRGRRRQGGPGGGEENQESGAGTGRRRPFSS